MRRSPYRPSFLPFWLKEMIATVGLVLLLASMIVLSIYGMAVMQ